MYAPSGVAATPRARATSKVIRLLTATFNAGNAEPSADLSPWIPRNGEGYDVIVVGTQECTWSGKAHKSKKKDDGGDSSDEDVATPHMATAGGVTTGNAAMPSAAAVAGEAPSAVPSEEAASVPHPASGSAPQPPGLSSSLVSPKATQASLFAAAERGLAGGGVKGALAGVGSYLSGQPTLSASCDFFRVVSHHVGPDFKLVQSLLMWQIGIEVFVRNELYPSVSAVESGSEATGLLGLTPNKGGAAVALRIHDTSLCFISSHLAAHTKHVAHRNENTVEILNGIRLGRVWNIDADSQFQHCFWMGDLNYRIDLGISSGDDVGSETHAKSARVRELVAAENYSALLEADQLKYAQKHGSALVGFREAPIHFQPTFKVDRKPGFHHKEQRIPAYCDRILWKSHPLLAGDVRCISYEAHGSIATSDHKPVSASFEVNCYQEVDCVAPVDAAARTPTIQFLHLSGKDLLSMDINGLSDPYVLFFCDPDVIGAAAVPDSTTPAPTPQKLRLFKSTVKPRTLNPTWVESEIPRLPLRVSSSAQLKRAHLFVVVMDRDVAGDDRMGCVVIPLAEAARSGTPYAFTLPVEKGGRHNGMLSGQFQIVWPQLGDAAATAGDSRASSKDPKKADAAAGGGCCAVQ